MMGVWNARLLDDSLHKALYGRGKALYQSTHHYKDFGLLDIHVTMGDQVIEAEELFKLADLKVPLVRFRGEWVEIDADFWRNRNQLTLRQAVRIGLGADQQAEADNVFLATTGWLSELLESLQQKSRIRLLDTPAEFKGQLRPYQQLGYSWLDFLRWWGLGACLADDMGLGKTIQTRAAILRDHQEGNEKPNLLICPTSVINNWQREAQKFTSSLPVMLHHGAGREHSETFAQQANKHQVVITSYGTMTRDQKLLASVDWRSVTLDEAQNIKNPATRQAQAVRSLPADYRIALTGTPVENHVGDLWAIMQFLNPGLLGSQAEFKRRYFNPIQANRDDEAAAKLQKATGPFILRRVKTDPSIIDDLPDKRETRQYCNLTSEQVTLLGRATRRRNAAGRRRGHGAPGLHPRHAGQAEAGLQPSPPAAGRQLRHRRPLRQTRPPRRVAGRHHSRRRPRPDFQPVRQDGRHPATARAGNLRPRDSYAPRRRLPEEPRSYGRPVPERPARTAGIRTVAEGRRLRPQPATGQPRHTLRPLVEPRVENQATDRAFRIGQTKDVHVHKLTCAGTLEDRIGTMIEVKQQTAEQVVGVTSERWLTELSNTELREVLALSATPED